MSQTSSHLASSPAHQANKGAASPANTWQCQEDDGEQAATPHPCHAWYTFVFTPTAGQQYMSSSKAQVTESELYSLGRVAAVLWFCSRTIQAGTDDAVCMTREEFTTITASMLKVVTPAWDYDAVQQTAAGIYEKTTPGPLKAKQTMDLVSFTKGMWTLTNMFLPSNSSWHLRALWIAKVRLVCACSYVCMSHTYTHVRTYVHKHLLKYMHPCG
jgi:hypothetical protein